jgi:hypothetical protein
MDMYEVNPMGKKYRRLEKHIEGEYERKGYSRKRAEYIARAAAGKVYREKMYECRYCGSVHSSEENRAHHERLMHEM